MEMAVSGGHHPQTLRSDAISNRPPRAGGFAHLIGVAVSGGREPQTPESPSRFPGGPGAPVPFAHQLEAGVGIEPTEPCGSPVFETGAFGLSANLPCWWSKWGSNPPRRPCKGCLRPALAPYWWTLSDSNRPHPACKTGALPNELKTRKWYCRSDSNRARLGHNQAPAPTDGRSNLSSRSGRSRSRTTPRSPNHPDRDVGREEGTRTLTSRRTPAPQAGASTSSATTHHIGAPPGDRTQTPVSRPAF